MTIDVNSVISSPMFIQENLNDIIVQLLSLFKMIFLNKIMVLAGSSQLFSMVVKALINSAKSGKISFKKMATYGGMPSSHTAFIMAVVFGVGFDKEYSWNHPYFGALFVIACLVLVDAVKFRGNVDRLNDIVRRLVAKDPELKEELELPPHIAHKTSEVIGGTIFAFVYTMLFYLLLGHLF